MANRKKPKNKKKRELTLNQQIDRHMTLSLALMRSTLLDEFGMSFAEEMANAPSQSGYDFWIEILTMQPTNPARATWLLWLHLATLEVAVEYWATRGFHDEEVDRLLAVEHNRELLREVRHRIFHASGLDHPTYSQLENHLGEIAAWANLLTQAMSRYTRAWFDANVSDLFRETTRAMFEEGRADHFHPSEPT